MPFNGKSILVTGGTGSFGRRFVEVLLRKHKPKKVVVFSRDELKQFEMQQAFPQGGDSPVRYFIGDIRDPERLRRAFGAVDIVVHTAALKQIPACEFNPYEAVQTNIIGTRNVIDAAIDRKVEKVLSLSSDKAVNPANLYGATKLCAEKLVTQSNSYSQIEGTRLSCARYGNVMGSRGSVVDVFRKQRESGKVTLTDGRMTRFWITLDQGVDFVIRCLELMRGGEVFVPKIPSIRVTDLVDVLAPDCKVETIGIRPGEKLHELLLSADEARHAMDIDGMYMIKPPFTYEWWPRDGFPEGAPLPEGFQFASDTNERWLSKEELREMTRDF